jgi:hypothetical protein
MSAPQVIDGKKWRFALGIGTFEVNNWPSKLLIEILYAILPQQIMNLAGSTRVKHTAFLLKAGVVFQQVY